MLYVLWLIHYEGHECHDTGALDRLDQRTLVLRTCPMAFRRIYLALGVHETADEIGILVIDLVHLLIAEVALLSFHKYWVGWLSGLTGWQERILADQKPVTVS
jgi:hypothetical protein